MTSFVDDILNSAGNATPPPPLPVGSYIFQIVDWSQDQIPNEKKTPIIRVDLGIESSIDVAPELLKEIDLTKKKVRMDFFLTEDALWRLDAFAESTLGLNIQRPRKVWLGEFRGRRFQGTVSHRMDQKSGAIFPEIKKTAALQPVV